jgi:hypothetical protein
LLCSVPALSGPLEDAQSAHADFDFASCKERVEEALDLAASRDDRVEAYRLLGLCHAALGETEEAREAFIVMLAVDPKAKLPDGLSPRFTSAYLEAKGHWLNKTALQLEIEDEREERDLRVLTVKVTDNADLIRKVAWRITGGTLSPALRSAERMEMRIPQGEDVELIGLDEAAGEVAVLPVPKVAPVGAEGEGEGEGEGESGDDPTPILITLGAVGALVAAGVTTAVVLVLVSSPDQVNLVGSVEFGE